MYINAAVNRLPGATVPKFCGKLLELPSFLETGPWLRRAWRAPFVLCVVWSTQPTGLFKGAPDSPGAFSRRHLGGRATCPLDHLKLAAPTPNRPKLVLVLDQPRVEKISTKTNLAPKKQNGLR